MVHSESSLFDGVCHIEYNTLAVYPSNTTVLFLMQFRYINNEVYIDFMACRLKHKLVLINSVQKHKAQQSDFSVFCLLFDPNSNFYIIHC